MRTQPKHSTRRRKILFLAALCLFGVQGAACFVDDPAPAQEDPRLGREKKVRFTSGCTGSVTMPVGASETMHVASAIENVEVPADLTQKSTDPSVIEIKTVDNKNFEMKALKKGQTDIEVYSAGARFDWLTFHVEPAKAVQFMAEPSVLAGGRLGLGITDVFGACGTEECPLFGHSFISWSVEPTTAATLLKDELGIAHFTGGMAGMGDIVGDEPSEGGELLRHPIEVVDPATITGLSALLQLPAQGDNEAPAPVPLPAQVNANGSFRIRLNGDRTGKSPVAISRHDIVWTTPPEIILIPQSEPADTVQELFSASETTGTFTLTAKVALLGGMEKSFAVTVVKAP